MTVRAHLKVSGVVQGVNFRWRTMDEARRAGVRGWVRNLADGRVEAVLEGERDDVDRVIAWCRRGPRGAVVADVEVDWEAPEGLEGFNIRY